MIRESLTVDEVIAFLNELVSLDPGAMHRLVANRVRCDDPLADHHSVQVARIGSHDEVGFLGVLNGAFGADDNGRGAICATYGEASDDYGILTQFARTPALPRCPRVREG